MVTFLNRLKRAWKGYTGSLTDIESWDDFYSTNLDTASGVRVDADKALSFSPVWQGVDLISGDISRLPFIVYERVKTEFGDGKQRAVDHPSYYLLKRQACYGLTSNLWRSRMVAHALLYGDAFSWIERDSNFNPVGLHWLHSEDVEVCWNQEPGNCFYRVNPSNRAGAPANVPKRVVTADMFHLQGLSVGHTGGCGIVHFAAQVIGKSLAAEQYGAEFFKNGAVAQGFLSHPGQLSAEARANFLKGWERRHKGGGNHHKIALLEEGISWHDMGVSPEDAMLLEFAAFSVKDIARFFNVPPGKLGDDSRTSYSSVEQENRSYFNSTLGKWITRLESEANDKLFTERQKRDDSHFAEFKLDALFKADTAERFTSYSTAIQWGIKSRNEIRAEENLNPVEGGDVLITPLNMQDINAGADELEIEADDEYEADEARAADLLARQDALTDAFCRCNKRLLGKAKRLPPSKYLAGINDLAEHRTVITEILSPSLRLAGADSKEVAGQYLAHVQDLLLNVSDCQPAELKQRLIDAETSLNTYTTTLAIELLTGK